MSFTVVNRGERRSRAATVRVTVGAATASVEQPALRPGARVRRTARLAGLPPGTWRARVCVRPRGERVRGNDCATAPGRAPVPTPAFAAPPPGRGELIAGPAPTTGDDDHAGAGRVDPHRARRHGNARRRRRPERDASATPAATATPTATVAADRDARPPHRRRPPRRPRRPPRHRPPPRRPPPRAAPPSPSASRGRGHELPAEPGHDGRVQAPRPRRRSRPRGARRSTRCRARRVIADGRVFVVTIYGVLHALDLRNGAVLWTKGDRGTRERHGRVRPRARLRHGRLRLHARRSTRRPGLCCGRTTCDRSPVAHDGRVYGAGAGRVGRRDRRGGSARHEPHAPQPRRRRSTATRVYYGCHGATAPLRGTSRVRVEDARTTRTARAAGRAPGRCIREAGSTRRSAATRRQARDGL